MKKWMMGKSDLNFERFSKFNWVKFRETFSRMIGFGFALIAYIVSLYIHMYKNFNKLEDALFDYISFPIKVLDNFNQIGALAQGKNVSSALWQEMYLIIGISFIVFFIGYFIGRLLVNLRYKKLKTYWKQEKVSIPPHKIIILE